MPGHAQQRLNRKMEPEAPLPPQPPELTARYNKKVLTLEEIVQAHGNSVHAQKYSIEVVGGKIKAVCNDCKVALSCGNLSDAKRHQCNKRPRSGQDATDADGASNDMPFERITACWNPAQRLPANIMTEFWRRIHMWFIDAEIPFAKTVAMGVSDGFPHLAVAASRLLGVHATSAASEHHWSAWGRLFTSARTRLTLERAKMLIYIKANAGLGARHNTEAQLLARMGE
ncbi:hypothetical protein QJQ45_006979 [Haematococcus lacustris]|nr:hypothetical protein QJQ45_006979 [Haematococcus lacustris]